MRIVWDGETIGTRSYTVWWDGTNYLGNRVSSNVYLVRLFAPRMLRVARLAVVQ